MNEHEEIRRQVSKAYGHAVTSAPPGHCCEAVPKGTSAKRAYDRDVLEELPRDAVVNAFGCGNPVAFSEVAAGDVVVDLGCGAGIDLLLAARKVGPSGRVIGVDMTDEMLAKARETIAASEMGNIEVRMGLIEDLPVESASVDWVISNCVINLSPEKERVFAEIARVLKPGGRMIVADIVAEDLPPPVRASLDLYCSCVAGAISEHAYGDGLRRAGLVDVQIRERIEYDVTQVEELIQSDRWAAKGAASCCCGGGDDPSGGDAGGQAKSLGELAASCRGKVWSAVIFARKPE